MICNKCRTDKPKDAFYASNGTTCKECVKDSVKKNRLEKIDYYRSFDNARASMPHRVAARKDYQATTAFAESHQAAAKRWASKYPDRRKASHIVSNAVRDGKLTKTPCHICGVEKVEGHHPDYSKPLNVVWLCTEHHKEVHRMVA